MLMQHDWIIDVLADLKAYASKNRLTALALELDDVTLIAATEISSVERNAPLSATHHARTPGYLY